MKKKQILDKLLVDLGDVSWAKSAKIINPHGDESSDKYFCLVIIPLERDLAKEALLTALPNVFIKQVHQLNDSQWGLRTKLFFVWEVNNGTRN